MRRSVGKVVCSSNLLHNSKAIIFSDPLKNTTDGVEYTTASSIWILNLPFKP